MDRPWRAHRGPLLGAAVVATAALGAPAQPVAGQNLADHTYATDAIVAGSRLYSAECALCHGANGDEVDRVDLRQSRFPRARSDDDIRRVITTGVGTRMPSFDLTAVELDGLIAYIRAGFDPEGVAVRIGDAARGEQLFRGGGECASCHRVNGVGPRFAPDLSDIGAQRTPAALQRALVDPRAALLPINRPVRAVTRSGETIHGRRLNEDTYTVQLIDDQERLRSLVKSELVEYEISTTPTMQPTTLSTEEVADLLGYLLTLTGTP